MPKAVAGKPYTIVSGDNLTRIAKQAYGEPSKWTLIWDTNKATLRSGNPDLIFPGEVIQLPLNPEVAKIQKALGLPDDTLTGKEPDDFTLILDGNEILVESGRVVRTMDTITDGWTARIAWDPDNTTLAKVLRPYSYGGAEVYLGSQLAQRGLVYTLKSTLDAEGQSVSLEGFSRAADAIDSSVQPPYERKKITLEQRARELIEPLGLSVTFEVDEDEQFNKVTAAPSDTIFSHLASLATQRHVLMSSDVEGNVVFYQSRVTKPVGVILEDLPPYQTLEATFDGRKRFNAYRIIGPSRKRRAGNAIEAIARDDNVPRSRSKTERVTEATAGDIQSIADWRRSKQAADALTIAFPVDSWYSPKGELWRENTIVTVVSKTIFAPDGFDFLVRSVEYIFEAGGTTAVLNLVPPEVYTGKPIKEPWSD